MKKRKLKTYEQYKVDYELSKGFDDTTISKKQISNIYKNKYEKMYVDYLLMMDVVDDNSNENINDVVISINKNDFQYDVDSFYTSFNKSKRIEFLTPYTKEELQDFKLFKLRGYNIGFAIKKNGDIILVHNNENVGGIGDILIKKAIEYGGTHLDHFDGFLTGFYKRNGFKFNSNDIFNEEYKPKNWDYEKIDIYNKNKSIYAEEFIVETSEFLKAEYRYNSGCPDVVYRILK